MADIELTCRGYSSNGKLIPCAEEGHEEGDEVDLVDGIKRLVVGFSDERKDDEIGEQFKETYDKHHRVVMTLSANSYTSFRAFSGVALSPAKYCESVVEI